jgi:nucleotide-binding universal stress UspA family protein
VGVNFDISGYERALVNSARAELQRLVPPTTAAGETVVTRGTPYKEILRVATERQADLIVVGVHGRNVLDRMVFGSTTEHLVRRATCPVLAVPASSGE